MKILLVYADEEAGPALVADLEDSGHDVRWVPNSDPEHMSVRDTTPEAIVACVEQDAGAAIEAVAALRKQKLFRNVPVLFTGTDESGLEAAMSDFPKASFARKDTLQTALASMSS